MTFITEAVQRGADLLDERLPGWRKAIDVPSLDLDSTENCVLGQLFNKDDGNSSYERGALLLGLGFGSQYDEGTTGYYGFTGNTRAWKKVLGVGATVEDALGVLEQGVDHVHYEDDGDLAVGISSVQGNGVLTFTVDGVTFRATVEEVVAVERPVGYVDNCECTSCGDYTRANR